MLNMPTNSTPKKNKVISDYFKRKSPTRPRSTNFFGMASHASRDNVNDVVNGAVGGVQVDQTNNSEMGEMSPIEAPGRMKRALSRGAPPASLSLRTVTSMSDDPLEPMSKEPRTDLEKPVTEEENVETVLKEVSAVAAAVPHVKMSGIKVIPEKIPVQRDDKTHDAESRQIEGALGAIRRVSRVSESWDHSCDVNKTLYDDSMSLLDENVEELHLMDDAGYVQSDVTSTLSQKDDNDNGDSESVISNGYGAGYNAGTSNQVSSVSALDLQGIIGQINDQVIRIITTELGPVIERVISMETKINAQVALNGGMRNEIGMLNNNVAGLQYAVVNIRESNEQNKAVYDRQFDEMTQRMDQLLAAHNDMERRVLAAEHDAAEAKAAAREATESALRANAAAERALAGGNGQHPEADFCQNEVRKLKEIIRRQEIEDIRYWRSTMLVSGLSANVSGRNVYDQARRLMKSYDIDFLVDECSRLHVTAAGNVRMTFSSVATALDMLNSAKRVLARFRGERIRVELLVPPEFVPRKKELTTLGMRLKSERMCDSFDVVIIKGGNRQNFMILVMLLMMLLLPWMLMLLCLMKMVPLLLEQLLMWLWWVELGLWLTMRVHVPFVSVKMVTRTD